jgi:ParB family chromosome partitioning protein
VLDVAILESLATDKLEVEAAWLANEHGYGFVRASLDSYVQSWQHEDLRRAAIEMPEPSEEERKEVEALEAEIDALAQALEDEDAEDFACQEIEAKIAEHQAQLRTIAARPPVLDPEVRCKVGFFLLLDEAGTPRLDRTPYALVGEETDNESGGQDTHAEAAAGGAGAGGGATTGAGAGEGGAGSAASSSAPAKPKLSQRLVEELAMQRRDILALHVARDPDLAFDLAVFLMVKDEGGYCYDSAGSSLSARAPNDPVLRSAMPEAPVNALLAQDSDALDRSWTAHETLAARFEAFRALPRAAREAWLGVAIARTLEASAGAGGRPCAFHDHLGSTLGIDVAQHWRPTALNWFDRVPKAACLAALTEVAGAELAARHAKAKKAEIAEACEKVFAGEGILTAEVKAAALAWVPEAMRFAASEAVDPASPDADHSPPWDEDAPLCAEQVDPIVIASVDEEGAGAAIDEDSTRASDGDDRSEDQPRAEEATGTDAAAEPEDLANPAPAANNPVRTKPRRKARKARKSDAGLDQAA